MHWKPWVRGAQGRIRILEALYGRRSRPYGYYLPLRPHTGGVNIQLALGPEVARRPRLLCFRDGDLIPCSMTIALLASSRGSLHPSSWNGPLAHSCGPCTTGGRVGRELVLPLISVDVAPRVGGLGAKLFSGVHWKSWVRGAQGRMDTISLYGRTLVVSTFSWH